MTTTPRTDLDLHRHAVVRAALCLSMVAVAACASSAPVTPTEVVLAHVAAARAGDERAAWELLAPEARARAPLPTPAGELPPAGAAVEVERVAMWRAGTELGVDVVRGQDGWQLRTGVLGLLRAETPEAALLAFSRAVLSRDVDALLGLVPAPSRARWTAASLGAALDGANLWPRWAALAEAIRAGGGAAMSRTADRGIARYGETAITLVREGAAWKVFDLSPSSVYTRPHESTRQE